MRQPPNPCVVTLYYNEKVNVGYGGRRRVRVRVRGMAWRGDK